MYRLGPIKYCRLAFEQQKEKFKFIGILPLHSLLMNDTVTQMENGNIVQNDTIWFNQRLTLLSNGNSKWIVVVNVLVKTNKKFTYRVDDWNDL